MVFQYLKDKSKLLLLLFLCTCIFAVVFFLYNLPVIPALYGGLLCLFLLFVLGLYDFTRYLRRHKELYQLKKSIVNCAGKLPLPRSQSEKDYHALVEEFDRAYRAQISKHDAAWAEMADFYTLWVHQIKTPIAAMRMLMQEENGCENAQLLQELFKIERYVELVLGYLRIEDISSDLALNSYCLEDIVKQAVKKYAPMFIHKKIRIELDALTVPVLTDEKWLVFVIEQLLSNALKYTEAGRIRIYAESDKTLVIADTGIGIAPEDLPRVFEKGFTGFNGRMDKKSTGLGLYLCKKTLDKLHHKIRIFSTPGEGTMVKISLASRELRFE